MTRFFITLQQGVDFVIKNIARMYGGEIFIPKIPSMRIVDVANALAPNLPTKIIGIRAGEKLHEIMITADDSRLTLEFDDHFVIKPTIKFSHLDDDYATNKLGEQGKEVCEDFEYSSDKNSEWMSKEQFLDLIVDNE